MDWLGAIAGTAIGAGSGGVPWTGNYNKNVANWTALGATKGVPIVTKETGKLTMAAVGAAATIDKKKGIYAGYTKGLPGVVDEVKKEAALPVGLLIAGALVIGLLFMENRK